MSTESIVLKLLLAAALLIVNAALVWAETTLIQKQTQPFHRPSSPRRSRSDAAMNSIRKRHRAVIAARFGTAITAISLGWVAVPVLAEGVVAPAFGQSAVTWPIGTIAFLLATWIYFIFGQSLPRRLASTTGDAAFIANVLLGLYQVTSPLIKLGEVLTGFIVRIVKKEDLSAEDSKIEDEVPFMNLRSHRLGELGATQRDLVASIFDFSERSIGQIMTPRSDVASVEASMRVREAVDVVRQFGFNRFPVFEGDRDQAIGVVHYRELLEEADGSPSSFVTDVMHAPLMLEEGTPVSLALKKLQARRCHLAIVVNSFGSTTGIVTLEDLLEELVGEAEDADAQSKEHSVVEETRPGVFELGGDLMLGQVEEALDVDLGHVGYQTVGGYIFNQLGRKPQVGDEVKVGDVVFDVLAVKGTRIKRIRAQHSRESAPSRRRAQA